MFLILPEWAMLPQFDTFTLDTHSCPLKKRQLLNKRLTLQKPTILTGRWWDRNTQISESIYSIINIFWRLQNVIFAINQSTKKHQRSQCTACMQFVNLQIKHFGIKNCRQLDYLEYNILGCEIMSSRMQLPPYWKNLLPPASQ